MSKLAVVNYVVPEAERRWVQRKIALIRATLKRCADLHAELAALEPVIGEDWARTLAQYEAFEKASVLEFAEEHNRLEDALPGVAEQLEKALAEARAKRTRLELTAATLLALDATSEEKKLLAGLDHGSAKLYADSYENAAAQVEAMLRKRLATPLEPTADPQASSRQLALAAELLAGSDARIETLPQPAPAAPEAKVADDAARINKLAAQIAGLDATLAPFDDLIERLRQLPATKPAQRALLIDSIEIAAAERLAAARRKREVRDVLEDGLAWLSPFASLTADGLRGKLEAASATGDLGTMRAARDEAKAWAEAEARRQDGARIRAALVSELQQLGYEVNVQGAEWAEGTRITAARPNEPNYDVELGAAPGGKVQSKVRAYDHAGRSAGVNRRDVEVEQGWCDDLAKLNKALAERGIAADVLREDGPGTAAQVPMPARTAAPVEPGRAKQLERKA